MGIPRRLERRCSLMSDLRATLRPTYHADFGWEGYSAQPRAYAVDTRFLGGVPAVDVGRRSGIGQAQSGITCPTGARAELPAGAHRLDPELDPGTGHLTYPQTMADDVVVQLLHGDAFAVPASGL